MPRKPLDPVTRYATDVTKGTVVASRLVALACARHLRDVEEQQTRGLKWKPDQAQRAIDFFADVLFLPEETASDEQVSDAPTTATPFVLQPWQQFIVGSLFGWYDARGYRRFRVAFAEVSKGAGKTPLFAGCLLYMLVADGERGAQLFCAAVTKDQAKLAFTDCDRMVAASPHLKDLIDRKVNNLAVLETGSFIRPISSEKRGLDGKRVHGAIIDEEHEHPDDTVYLKVRAGTKGRRNALIMIPTNSGFDKETVCGRHHDYSIEVLTGAVENDSWFAFVCHLDACEKCHEAGKWQPSDECADCDDWKTEGPHWLKAAPNLGVSISRQYLREQVREAVGVPSQRNMVRRLNFCQWTQQQDVWIPAEAWAACRADWGRATGLQALERFRGRECFVGCDLSGKIDLAATDFVFPREMTREERTEAVLEEDKADLIDKAIDLVPFFWMPERTLQKRSEEDNQPYKEWAQAGHITTTAGELVDHDAIADFLIAASSIVHIRGIGVDMAGATAFVTRLQRHFGDELVVEVPQGFRSLSEPSKTLEALVTSKNLTHDGNPVMAMCVANAAIEENSWQEIRPIKLSQRKRIDGLVALVDGVKTMIAADPPSDSVYEKRGLSAV